MCLQPRHLDLRFRAAYRLLRDPQAPSSLVRQILRCAYHPREWWNSIQCTSSNSGQHMWWSSGPHSIRPRLAQSSSSSGCISRVRSFHHHLSPHKGLQLLSSDYRGSQTSGRAQVMRQAAQEKTLQHMASSIRLWVMEEGLRLYQGTSRSLPHRPVMPLLCCLHRLLLLPSPPELQMKLRVLNFDNFSVCHPRKRPFQRLSP